MNETVIGWPPIRLYAAAPAEHTGCTERKLMAIRLQGLIVATSRGQLDKFFVGELPADLVVHGIGNVRLRDQGQSLRPGERRLLALRVQRRFAPGIKQIKAFLRFAAGARFTRVHVDQ
jgi:hypothetical protein